MIRGVSAFVLASLLILASILPVAGTAKPHIATEPGIINIGMVQGQQVKRTIWIINEGNTTLVGELEFINCDCREPPEGSLSVRNIELAAGESKLVTLVVRADILDSTGDYTFDIDFEPQDDYRNRTEIGEVHVTVDWNYFVWIGLPGLLIGLVIVFLVYKHRRKTGEVELEE
jgi:hypothetical protein